MKYDINKTYTVEGYKNLKLTINQTGSKAMIREEGQEKATKRQGYRVIVENETIGYGDWKQSEHDLLCEVIKCERYSHLAYKEAYYDLLNKLASIGFVQKNDDDEYDDRF